MSTSTIIPKDKPITFLTWLYHRLKNKYGEEDIVLNRLADLVHNYTIVDTSIKKSEIEYLCKKHFIQFDMDEEYGFSKEIKTKIKELVIDTIVHIGMKLESESNPRSKRDDTDFVYELMGE
jgi:hypothetical protein